MALFTSVEMVSSRLLIWVLVWSVLSLLLIYAFSAVSLPMG